MRPERLELEGFGAFRDPTVVDFTDIELVALVGATGAGKSTIIDGITFALYGSVARYEDLRTVVPVISQLSTRARLRLDFEVGGRRYTAVRLVQRTPKGATTKEARLEQDDGAGGTITLAADARTMTAEVTRLLGLDMAQFNRTVVLPQGRFADFLHDNPAERQATLRQLLGVGRYRELGSMARQRTGDLRAQLGVMRPELEEGEAELTSARRAELVARHDAVVAARDDLIGAIDVVSRLDAELAELERHLVEVDGQFGLLAAVAPPGDLHELDRRLVAAEAAAEGAAATLTAARQRRRAADAAVHGGPDLSSCSARLRTHEEATAASTAAAAAIAAREAAESDAVARRASADEVTTRQRQLDADVAEARAAEVAARQAVDDAPDPARIEQRLELRQRHVEAVDAVTESGAAASLATEELTPLARALGDAEDREQVARRVRDDRQQRAGAAGLVGLLAVGEPCPLCLQDVAHLPEHHVTDELDQAGKELEAASDEVATVRRQVRAAERAADERSTAATAAARALATLEAQLDGVPGDAELRDQLAAAGRRRDGLRQAASSLADAERAAAAHRDDPAVVGRLEDADAASREVVRLRALEEDRRRRDDELRQVAAGLPAEIALRAAVTEAERLATEQRTATDELQAAEQADDLAAHERAAAHVAAASAAESLRAARDHVSVLRPPPLPGAGLAADWLALATWADELATALRTDRDQAAATSRSTIAERQRVVAATHRGVAAVLGEVGAAEPLPAVRDRMARAEADAAAAVAVFDDRVERHVALRARVEAVSADAQVAEQLGHLLRADGFEAWLMQAALEDLVDAATTRLRELSGGQFSLELVEREFMVRDHANADELRSARTLSGGETFLASLSLALALADATAELAAEGAPTIESIFLDEGFGTLDPGTLDVVAAAIEELGSGGRMVAVVTHLRELADRMPVRLEVTKHGTSSTVERVEV